MPSSIFQRALVAAGAALILPWVVEAQDADTREVQSYVLTQTGLSKYTRATEALGELPGAACEDDDADSESDSGSVSDMVAKLEAVPGAKQAIASAGMSTREYVIFSFSLLQNGLAAWAVSQPGGQLPAGVSKANVDFFNAHKADLQKLEELSKSAECTGETADDETQERD